MILGKIEGMDVICAVGKHGCGRTIAAAHFENRAERRQRICQPRHALFEHLTPTERIKFLIGAWRHLPVGGRLVIIETPNRLSFFDWHSSQMPFQDQLPSEIAFLWNAFSRRQSVPADIRATTLAEMSNGNVERLYRFGRGASFHEFYAALGPDNFDVINKSILDRREFMQWNQSYIDVLAQQLALVEPTPHVAFAQPCLDLIIAKTGESRMQQ